MFPLKLTERLTFIGKSMKLHINSLTLNPWLGEKSGEWELTLNNSLKNISWEFVLLFSTNSKYFLPFLTIFIKNFSE